MKYLLFFKSTLFHLGDLVIGRGIETNLVFLYTYAK